MITIEDLQATSLKTSLTKYWEGYTKLHGVPPESRRHPSTVHSCVLTNEQVNQYYKELDAERYLPEQEVLSKGLTAQREQLLVHGLTMVSNDEYFFLTDDGQFGWEICRQKGMLPVTYPSLPYVVGKREQFPDGVLRSIEDMIAVFEKNAIQLKTDQELVDYLNSDK